MRATLYMPFLILFIAAPGMGTQGYCQDNPYKSLEVRIAPLNLFDPVTGVIQLGLQKRFNQRLALSLDYGLKFNQLSFNGLKDERKDYRYYKGKAELKYFFKRGYKELNINNPYLSIQGFYFPQRYRKDNSWIVKDGKSYHYDYSNITRNVTVGSILVGDEEALSSRFTLDYYIGLGIRRMIITQQPTNAVEAPVPEKKEWSPVPIDRFEGTSYRLHVALGAKIGFLLTK